jgi:Putative DNA-binding domain
VPNLWNRLESFIANGRETRKVDLKREIDLSKRSGRAKFVKDVLALANTPGGTGYLIIGVVDAKERSSPDPAEYVPGFSPRPLDDFKQQMAQALHTYATPVPTYEYEEIIHPAVGRNLGVVIVERGLNPPYYAAQDGEGLRKGEVYFRIGADTFPATPEQITVISATPNGMCLVMNFGRPLDPPQLAQLRECTRAQIYEVIQPPQMPPHFDESKPFAPQVSVLVDQIGLTKEEWQRLPIVINLPGLAPVAAALLAELHGRMGHFPKVIRLGPVGADRTNYQVAEIIEMQRVRDEANQRDL